MYKFFVVSNKMLDKLNPVWISLNYIYIYMVWEWNNFNERKNLITKKLKFKDIQKLMELSFESLDVIKHDYGSWYWIDIEELRDLWINFIDSYFTLEWRNLLKKLK